MMASKSLMWLLARSTFKLAPSKAADRIAMSGDKFSDTVKNLLKMKPKPHDRDSGDKSSQSDSRSDQSSSKRLTKSRNSGED